MAYPNYAITRIEEYLAALADGSAAEKAILASAIEEGGLGWIEPAQVLYETDAATEEISLTAPIVELTEGDSLTLSFTLGSDPAVEATATVTDVDGVLTATFELSKSQAVTITDEAITFSADPDGAAFTITQPAVVHMIDSKFIPAELPAATSSDEGKVLTVDSNGDPEWSTPSGGAVIKLNPAGGQINPLTDEQFEAANFVLYEHSPADNTLAVQMPCYKFAISDRDGNRDRYVVKFMFPVAASNTMRIMTVTLMLNGSYTTSYIDYTLTPNT